MSARESLERISGKSLPYVLWAVRVLLVVGILRAWLGSAPWSVGFFGMGSLLLSFYPHLLKRLPRVRIPASVQILFVIVALIGGGYLGGLRNFYRWPWWDNLTHFLGGIVFYLAAYANNQHLIRRDEIRLDYGFLVLFSFALAMTIGALWELVEMTAGYLPGLSATPEIVSDAASDLLFDTLGVLLALIATHIYHRRRTS